MDEVPRQSPSVLVANDHEWTARSLETILTANGYSVARAFTARQAIERATESRPDAFVLDVQLPDQDGMSLCRAIRKAPTLGPTIPIVLTTAGPSGRKERLDAHRAGAWEFFGQPLDGETLLLKLGVFLDSKRLVDELSRENLLDPETGLYNRTGLLRRSREMAADGARGNRMLGCVVLRPHVPQPASAIAAGEDLGRLVGAFLRRAGRSADAIGRLDQLDFGVVTLGAGIEELRMMVGRLNAALPQVAADTGGGVTLRAAVWSASESTVDPEVMLQETLAAVRGGEAGSAVVSGG